MMYTYKKSLDGFLRLTGMVTGKTVVIRIGRIEAIDSDTDGDYSAIRFYSGEIVLVRETPDTIFKILGQ